MLTPCDQLVALERDGFTLRPGPDGSLLVAPMNRLDDAQRSIIRENKKLFLVILAIRQEDAEIDASVIAREFQEPRP